MRSFLSRFSFSLLTLIEPSRVQSRSVNDITHLAREVNEISLASVEHARCSNVQGLRQACDSSTLIAQTCYSRVAEQTTAGRWPTGARNDDHESARTARLRRVTLHALPDKCLRFRSHTCRALFVINYANYCLPRMTKRFALPRDRSESVAAAMLMQSDNVASEDLDVF